MSQREPRPANERPHSFPKMKTISHFPIWCIVLALFLSSCAVPQASRLRDTLRTVFYDYNTQAYDACLAEIEKALRSELVQEQRATLLMTKASCEEEMGLKTDAEATLLLVKNEFERTHFADAAQRRLDGKDGDQREHLELNLDDPLWRRAAKRWNEKAVSQYFFPVGENARQFTARLLVFSTDRPDSIKTMQDAISRADAEFSLRGGTFRPKWLEGSTNDGYWEFEETFPNQKEPVVALERIILTESRFHYAKFLLRKPVLKPEEREKYLAKLKRVTLAGGK